MSDTTRPTFTTRTAPPRKHKPADTRDRILGIAEGLEGVTYTPKPTPEVKRRATPPTPDVKPTTVRGGLLDAMRAEDTDDRAVRRLREAGYTVITQGEPPRMISEGERELADQLRVAERDRDEALALIAKMGAQRLERQRRILSLEASRESDKLTIARLEYMFGLLLKDGGK